MCAATDKLCVHAHLLSLDKNGNTVSRPAGRAPKGDSVLADDFLNHQVGTSGVLRSGYAVGVRASYARKVRCALVSTAISTMMTMPPKSCGAQSATSVAVAPA